MRYTELLLTLLLWIHTVNLAPLIPKQSDEETDEDPAPPDSLLDSPQTGLEYEKYLEQVIQVLETNPEMREKLEGMTMEDLKSGKMADEIDMLDNNIRTELDELKRLEIQRLRTIARKTMEVGGSRTLDTKFVDNLIGHIDPANTNAFGPKDFEKLLQKATSDLEEADKRRKKDFKKYEMEKELRRRSGLKNLEEKERQDAVKEWEKAQDLRKNHKQMKHPGSKAQLEDVWEKSDHLEKETFNPKTFFMLHDTNGDLKLDSFELEALFIKEVAEIYQGTNADPKEKFEEIYRMREHVMNEIDTNKDKLVTLEEFMAATNAESFETDDGWEDLQQKELYTEDELEEYRAMYDEVVKEKKEKLRKEQEEYLKRRKDHGAGEPIVMDQERIRQVAGEAADEVMKKMEEKKLKFDPSNAAINKVEDLQAAQKQQEELAQRQAAQLQQAAQQAAQLQGKQPVPPDVAAEQVKLLEAQAVQDALAQQIAMAKQTAQQGDKQQLNDQQGGQEQHVGQQIAGHHVAMQQAVQQAVQQQGGQQQGGQQQAGQQQAGQQQDVGQEQHAGQQLMGQHAAIQQAIQQAAQQVQDGQQGGGVQEPPV